MPTLNEGNADAQQRGMPPGDAMHHLQDDAKALFDSAKAQGTEHLEQYRETAAQQIESLARSATSAADELQDNDTLGISHYISDAAGSLGTFAESLRGKSADELLKQVGQMAKDNPALFVAGSIALGFGLSRFLRASSQPLNGSGSPSSGSAAPSGPAPQYPAAGAEERLADDGEATPASAHVGDVTHASPVQPKDPLSNGPTADGHGDPDDSSGIQPSGAELGRFNPASPLPAMDAASTPGAATSTPTSKGQL